MAPTGQPHRHVLYMLRITITCCKTGMCGIRHSSAMQLVHVPSMHMPSMRRAEAPQSICMPNAGLKSHT